MGLRDIESTLPPGFRFHPSDEELVCHYLYKKVANVKVYDGTMVEVDLHIREPWELPGIYCSILSGFTCLIFRLVSFSSNMCCLTRHKWFLLMSNSGIWGSMVHLFSKTKCRHASYLTAQCLLCLIGKACLICKETLENFWILWVSLSILVGQIVLL